MAVGIPTSHASRIAQILDPSVPPRYDFGFAGFLKQEHGFSLEPPPPICKAYSSGVCPLGARCPDRHPPQANYNNLICKHWLRGLCKKGDSCEFLHEYNLRSMPECTEYAQAGFCGNGSDCLYLHIEPESKGPPCPHYERGFCALGPHCAARHIKRKTFCKYYMTGFCPNGRQCAEGGHPLWKEKDDLPKPEPRRIYTKEEQEAMRKQREEKYKADKEAEDREREERGLPSRRDGFRERGRGRGRGQWRDRNDRGGRGSRF